MNNKTFMGIVWGNIDDSFAISVIDADGNEIHRELAKKGDWLLMRSRLLALYNLYNPSVILTESNSIGVVNIEAFQAEGLPIRGVPITKSSKRDILDFFRQSLERKEITLTHPIRFNYGTLESEPDEVGWAIAYSLWARRYYGGANIQFA